MSHRPLAGIEPHGDRPATPSEVVRAVGPVCRRSQRILTPDAARHIAARVAMDLRQPSEIEHPSVAGLFERFRDNIID